MNEGVDEAGWDVEPGDEIEPMVQAVGRLLKVCREAAGAVELMQYSNHNIQGLLQTPEYARALYETRQPAYSPDDVERETAARMARKPIFEREPAPTLRCCADSSNTFWR